jgi:hypothetical protein
VVVVNRRLVQIIDDQVVVVVVCNSGRIGDEVDGVVISGGWSGGC